MDSFEFESGVVLENVVVEYVTRGVPEYDDEGNITNAIIYCPTLKGGYSIIEKYSEPDKDHDLLNQCFFIKIVSLGNPDSCSPSSTGLSYDFPSYTFLDRINFKKQFLFDKFKINKVFGIIGEGSGGFEVYTWACEYPDDMEFIIVLNSSFKTAGYHYVLVKCVEAFLDSSDDIYSETYSTSLSKMSVAVFRLLFTAYFPQNVLKNLDADEIDFIMEDFVDEALFMDIHDFHFRNDCILNFNVENKLSNIKAKALILGIQDFLLFNPKKDAVSLENKIENVTIRLFNSKRKYYDEQEDYTVLFNELSSFLMQFKK